MVLAYYGRPTSTDEVRRALGPAAQGANARQLVEGARRFGLRSRGVKLELNKLKYAPAGTILHWQMSHFVVLERVEKTGARILDPAVGPRRVTWKDLDECCTGIAILVEPGPEFVRAKPEKSRWPRYMRWLRASPGYWPRVIVLSVVLQLVALVGPAIMGLTVDKVVPRHADELLQLMAAGALIALSISLLTSFVRSNLLLHMRTYMDAQMTLELNEHLLSLPFSYFQQRSSGDLIMRLSSSAQIRDVLTSSALSAVLDGTMALVYFVLLLIVAPPLAAIAIAVAALQAVIVLSNGRRNAELMSEQLAAQAKLSSAQVEALTAIEPIKAMGAEARIAERFAGIYVEVLNASLDRGRLSNSVNTLTGALGFAGPTALLLTGAHLVLNGTLGTGGMLALSSLGTAFLTPVGALVGTFTQLQTLRSYMHRVEDILDAAPEPKPAQPRVSTSDTRGEIVLHQLWFSYENANTAILQDVSLTVRAGEFLAIVGPSGSGKSTLARLLCGLITPSSGHITFDGVEQKQWDPTQLRARLGIVTQDTRLLATSVRENISLFDDAVPLEAIETAAKQAAIHDDILRLPLGYDTTLSDGGGSLSGGQRQRVALARALLRSPAVLVLDEATSQLDTVTERRLQEQLDRLACTRVVIAHRLSTIRQADRIVVLDAGVVVDVGTHHELAVRCRVYRQLIDAQTSPQPAGRPTTAPARPRVITTT
jgi:ABC-type bacteriocin/lantibiotic exporter with double-glycine peptidase domain